LKRGGTGSSSLPLELAGARPAPAAPALQKLQDAPAAPRGERPMAAAGASREVLSGITLRGPVADRALVKHAQPQYPDWAQRELVEGSVRLYFEVLPDGRVKENVLVEKTSGVLDFDRNATRALVGWRFEPVADGVGEQWGSITFDFRLS
jgi:TonB family protein